MVKAGRPVIVLRSNGGLATIVACSTVMPELVCDHHYKLPRECMPKSDHFFGKDTWVKGDMIYTVSLKRLELVRLGKSTDRNYFTAKLGREHMNKIRACVLHGVGMGFLSQHLI